MNLPRLYALLARLTRRRPRDEPTVRLRLPTTEPNPRPLGIDLERRLNPPEPPPEPNRTPNDERRAAERLRERGIHPGGHPR